MKEVFLDIYNNNRWGGKESLSGPGSDMESTQNIRNALPVLFEALRIESVLDIPCGDFNWFKDIYSTKYKYIGADILREVVKMNSIKHSTVDFRILDITKDKLPKVDLIFTRDCLGHLSHEHIEQAVANIVEAAPKYFVSTHWPKAEMRQIKDGQWMPINMCHYLDDTFQFMCLLIEEVEGKYLGLWKLNSGI